MKRRRNSLRHAGWHYGVAGYYFVTICTDERACIFDDEVVRETVETVLRQLPTFNSQTKIALDEWIVMPNHIHVIIVILAGYAEDAPRPAKTVSGTVGAHVAAFKSTATRRINNVCRTPVGTTVWQRGYYDKIIRNERQLHAIRQYIIDNPERWAEDRENLDHLLERMTYHST